MIRELKPFTKPKSSFSGFSEFKN